MLDNSPYLMSGVELAWGFLLGHEAELPMPSHPEYSPREALEHVVRESLLRSPCGIAFSGGRDSSLVLAVATHVARRDGLADPVPITRVFPDVMESDEKEWQEAVVRHIGLSDWQRVVLTDELDAIGTIAQRHLREHGVVWPPAIAGDVPLVDVVPGGSVMDGEGGDEVLGFAEHRVAPVARLLRSPRPLRRRRVRAALGALAPSFARARTVRRGWDAEPITWLRPTARDQLLEGLQRLERTQPLSFAASVRMVPRRRTQRMLARNRRILAATKGVVVTSPLLPSTTATSR